jgi:hypothetical protein
VKLSEKITCKKSTFSDRFLKALIKFSYLANFQNFWTFPHWQKLEKSL